MPDNIKFIPGLQLSRLFYRDAVQPILSRHWLGLRYSAGLLGPGSDVQGFDTAQSMDHDWGPRLWLLLPDEDFDALSAQIDEALRAELPLQVQGFSTHFAGHADGTRWMQPISVGPVNHGVKRLPYRKTLSGWLHGDPDQPLRVIDWLTLPEQILLEVTSGEVFHDDLGLSNLRERLRYYPHEVWLYVLAAQWSRIGQEEAFVGRCAQVSDELGSRIVAARLVRDLMKLSFVLARQYAPYTKWFGAAFARLEIAVRLQPILLDVLGAVDWPTRERHLCAAYEMLARVHNTLNITEVGPTQVTRYYERPFWVIGGGRFAELTCAAIRDPAVLALPPNMGAIDQFVDSTDVLSNPGMFNRLKTVFEK